MCSLLGWAGVLTCGVLLILRYWDTIIKSSLFLIVTAALLPCSGFLVAYVIAKILCFVSIFSLVFLYVKRTISFTFL